MTTHEFTAGFLFAGLGAGARGFIDAMGQLGADIARFRNLGGVDFDPDACLDFEALTGGPSLCADLAKLQPAELRAFMGARRPDAIFTSPPCKGMSRLLGRAAAERQKYQELNALVFKGLFLVMEAWPDDPPPLIVLENVPGIATRGAVFLHQVRAMLAAAGYRLHEANHDCGEVGGLAQHRRRFLLVARREESCRAFVYQPSKQRVRGCGEVLGELPLPEDPAAGELHRMPRISALNWLRLALIPPGGDWRDLPKAIEPAPTPEDECEVYPPNYHHDPRVAVTNNPARHANKFEVQRFEKPVRTITSVAGVATGAPNVADPRVPLAQSGAAADGFKGRPGLFGVLGWEAPAQAVTGGASVSGSNTPAAVADPRLAMEHQTWRGAMGVASWNEPAKTVRGAMSIRQAPAAVADPRLTTPLAPGQPRREVFRRDPVNAWTEPVPAVTGPGGNQGAQNVADPRVPLTCEGRNGFYGVKRWDEPSSTVTGSMSIDNAPAAVADPRLGAPISLEQAVADFARIENARKAPPRPPVIVAADGTWHRPLTDLELAALQGIPAVVDGKPLRLSRGGKVSTIRERIGNAVPVGAAKAIAASLLKALLAHSLGTWFLSADAIWVRDDGATEDEVLHEGAEVVAHG